MNVKKKLLFLGSSLLFPSAFGMVLKLRLSYKKWTSLGSEIAY